MSGRLKRSYKKLLAIVSLTVTVSAAAPPEAPVADAAQRGDMEAVRALLRSGAEVNAAQGDGMTALHWAAELGDVELTRVLAYAGGNVRAGTRIGRYTPLHLAARGGHLDVARILLEAGSSPSAASTNSGATPLHLAASSGDPELVGLLLEYGADPDVRETSWGQTPLTFAAAGNRVDVIRTLLAAGADPDAQARSVDTGEMQSADAAAAERLKEVLQDFKDREGGGPNWQPTPSQVRGAIELSREIQMKWPDVPTDAELEDAPDDEGQEVEPAEEETAQPAADEKEEPGAEPEQNPEAKQEPEAEAEQQTEEAEEKEERGLNYAEQVGQWGGLTPLLHAVRQGHVEAVLALLDGGADLNKTSGDGSSPLFMAVINGEWDLATLLLERGADPNIPTIANATPLYAVLERQWEPRASYSHPVAYQQQQTTHLEMLELLLKAGADPNVRLNRHLWYMEYTFTPLRLFVKGATPFWRAAYAVDVDAMRLLKEYGADPGIPTMKGPERRDPNLPVEEKEDTDELDPSGLPPVPMDGPAIYPIHAATGVGYGQSYAGNAHRHVEDGWLAAVKFLVEETGADVNQRDSKGYTALHHAASRGDNETILYLVEHGADVTLVSREGQTTADMANGPIQRVQPFPETIELLVKLGSKNNNNCVSCE